MMSITHQAQDQPESEPAFGVLLRQYRIAAGLSQEALAERAGLSVRGLSDLERGARRRPYPETLRLLSDALVLGPAERTSLALAAHGRVNTENIVRSAVPETAGPVASPAIPPTELIGRKQEITELGGLIRAPGVRLLTLTGPGGVGKTRLATALVETMTGRERGFAELAAIAEPALVQSAVVSALGLREESDQSPQAALRVYLAERRFLLVLDNCEHVLEGVRVLVTDLLSACPDLVIVATSRAPLRLRSERLFPVPPLALPGSGKSLELKELAEVPAVALFIHRAQAARPDFVLTDENASVVVEICHRLDGLPLTIELAAARLRILSPSALLALLSERLKILARGAEDLPERQRTVRAAIAWSYELLDPERQQFFRQLGAFAGSFSLEAIAAVACQGDTFDALDGLEELADQSLVQRAEGLEEDLRFSMLETIREFALERLRETSEAEKVRRAHATHFAALASQIAVALVGPDQAAWLDRMESELPNLRAAFDWALHNEPSLALRLAESMHWAWFQRGHLTEAREALEHALATGACQMEPVRVRALCWAAWICFHQSDTSHGTAMTEEALALAQSIGDPSAVAHALLWHSHLTPHANDEEWTVAQERLHQARSLFLEVGDTSGAIGCEVALGNLAWERNDLVEAAARYEAGLARVRDVGEPFVRSVLLGNLGAVRGQQGQVEHARALLTEAVSLRRQIGDDRGAAEFFGYLGRVALDAGDIQEAAALIAEGLRTISQTGMSEYVAWSLEVVAVIALASNQAVQAVRLLGAADAVRERISGSIDPALRMETERERARALADLGSARFDQAWTSGRMLPMNQAVAEALGITDELSAQISG
jgi:predicted ATPase/DNA-binding XRE family transcriptional regulator